MSGFSFRHDERPVGLEMRGHDENGFRRAGFAEPGQGKVRAGLSCRIRFGEPCEMKSAGSLVINAI